MKCKITDSVTGARKSCTCNGTAPTPKQSLHSKGCIAMKSKDLLVGKGGPDGSPSSPKAMKSKDLLVGKGGPDGSPSSPKQ